MTSDSMAVQYLTWGGDPLSAQPVRAHCDVTWSQLQNAATHLSCNPTDPDQLMLPAVGMQLASRRLECVQQMHLHHAVRPVQRARTALVSALTEALPAARRAPLAPMPEAARSAITAAADALMVAVSAIDYTKQTAMERYGQRHVDAVEQARAAVGLVSTTAGEGGDGGDIEDGGGDGGGGGGGGGQEGDDVELNADEEHSLIPPAPPPPLRLSWVKKTTSIEDALSKLQKGDAEIAEYGVANKAKLHEQGGAGLLLECAADVRRGVSELQRLAQKWPAHHCDPTRRMYEPMTATLKMSVVQGSAHFDVALRGDHPHEGSGFLDKCSGVEALTGIVVRIDGGEPTAAIGDTSERYTYVRLSGKVELLDPLVYLLPPAVQPGPVHHQCPVPLRYRTLRYSIVGAFPSDIPIVENGLREVWVTAAQVVMVPIVRNAQLRQPKQGKCPPGCASAIAYDRFVVNGPDVHKLQAARGGSPAAIWCDDELAHDVKLGVGAVQSEAVSALIGCAVRCDLEDNDLGVIALAPLSASMASTWASDKDMPDGSSGIEYPFGVFFPADKTVNYFALDSGVYSRPTNMELFCAFPDAAKCGLSSAEAQTPPALVKTTQKLAKELPALRCAFRQQLDAYETELTPLVAFERAVAAENPLTDASVATLLSDWVPRLKTAKGNDAILKLFSAGTHHPPLLGRFLHWNADVLHIMLNIIKSIFNGELEICHSYGNSILDSCSKVMRSTQTVVAQRKPGPGAKISLKKRWFPVPSLLRVRGQQLKGLLKCKAHEQLPAHAPERHLFPKIEAAAELLFVALMHSLSEFATMAYDPATEQLPKYLPGRSKNELRAIELVDAAYLELVGGDVCPSPSPSPSPSP